MTFKEILKAHGLDDKTSEAVVADMKTNKIFTASEEGLDERFGKLKTDYDALTQQHGEATTLIAQLKKDSAANGDLQTKITEYETKMQQLEQALTQTRIDAALKVELLKAKALDVDYLTYKAKEKGDLSLDEKGGLKGAESLVSGLKTQFPTQFEGAASKTVVVNKLPDPQTTGDAEPKTLAEALEMAYEGKNN